jgi:hypothetical protein
MARNKRTGKQLSPLRAMIFEILGSDTIACLKSVLIEVEILT